MRAEVGDLARGRIREEDIDDLREKADIVEVISDYVQLKKAGRLFKGLCPFHDEKTPSFMVDPAKQLYHCFGCGEGGNVYTFLMKKEGLAFREAVERLASRVGYTLHYEGVSRERVEAEGRKERIYRLNGWAAELYHRVLTEGDAGREAMDYLASRGFGEEAVKTFSLGYAPKQWDFLYRRAMRKGFSAEDFLGAGLGARGERGIYDRFRGRIIFPIRDLQDRVVAFGGRILGEGNPKYLNSPETTVYVKSRHLYALNLSRREIVREGYAILVEGYTDVIGLWQAGIRNVAATLGTALGEEHFRLLSRLTEKVVLAFDADAAGLGASERGLEFLDKFNLDLRVIILDEGTDPADFVRERGAEEFRRRVKESVPLLDFCLDKILGTHDPRDTNSRIKGVNKALRLLADLAGDFGQEPHLKRVADWSGTDYSRIFNLYSRFTKTKGGAIHAASSPSPADVFPHLRAERELLRLLLHHPYMVEKAVLEIDASLFEDEAARGLARFLLERWEETAGEGLRGRNAARVVESIPSGKARNLATSLILEPSGYVDNIGKEDVEKIYRDLSTSLKEFYIERQIRSKKKDLERLSLSPRRDHDLERELSEEIYSLERLKRELRRSS